MYYDALTKFIYLNMFLKAPVDLGVNDFTLGYFRGISARDLLVIKDESVH